MADKWVFGPIVVERVHRGCIAYCDRPRAVAQGYTPREALKNLIDALSSLLLARDDAATSAWLECRATRQDDLEAESNG